MKRLVEKKASALELRKLGMSYTQIKQRLGVSKSSLSLWLRDLPLSETRLRELRDFNQQRIEKYRNTRTRNKEVRQNNIRRKLEDELLPMSKRELFIAGLMLYWGEGSKTHSGTVCVSNTDPKVIKFFVYWLKNVAKYPEDGIKVRLHIYSDMDVRDSIAYWSKVTSLPSTQFKKPYIKQSTLKGITYSGHGHGTCNIIVYNTDLFERIVFGIEAISKQSN